MSEIDYRGGTKDARVLHIENVPLERIADAVGTPTYCYSSGALVARYRAFAAAVGDATICYSVKANDNPGILRTLKAEGAGADVVSAGELRQVLAAGIAAESVVFAGVGKQRPEMAFALDAGIAQFNVESEAELEALNEVAAARNRRAPVALRVNPNVDAATHEKITTGRKENKFGIDFTQVPAVYASAEKLPGIEMVGLAVHIGSQLTQLAPFEVAFERLAGQVEELRAAGRTVKRLDLGGGLGISYSGETPPALEAYGKLVQRIAARLGTEIVLEPGRSLVGPTGLLLTRVVYVKNSGARTFVIVDAAMNDLLRPSLYDAYHAVQPVHEARGDAPRETIDIVGPICESGDVLASAREMPVPKPGDLLAIRDAGAYGAVMSSTYNGRPLPAEILVRGGDFAVTRARQSYDDLLARNQVPDWLA